MRGCCRVAAQVARLVCTCTSIALIGHPRQWRGQVALALGFVSGNRSTLVSHSYAFVLVGRAQMGLALQLPYATQGDSANNASSVLRLGQHRICVHLLQSADPYTSRAQKWLQVGCRRPFDLAPLQTRDRLAALHHRTRIVPGLHADAFEVGHAGSCTMQPWGIPWRTMGHYVK